MESKSSRPDVCDLLGIQSPILQAGMGPVRTVELAAAVSNAGGLGTISQGGPNLSRADARTHTRQHLEAVLELTDKPIAMNAAGVNLDSPVKTARTREAYLIEALRLKREHPDIRKQLKLVITSFGSPERRIDEINEVKEETDLLHFHKVAKVRHATKVEALGVDGVIAAGFEMGGHTHPPDDATTTFNLIPAVADAVDIPVIGAGGMKDGRSLVAALALGADGISLGTRFLTSQEMEVHEGYKNHIVQAPEASDKVVAPNKTPHRVIESPGSRKYEQAAETATIGQIREMEVDRVATAQLGGNVEDGMVAAGQVGGYIDSIEPAADIVHNIIAEARRIHSDITIPS